MPSLRPKLLSFLLLLFIGQSVSAQRDLSGAAEMRLALDRLRVLGSVLMIGAHPDDENTALLAYFARGRNARTAYLSLTRGEGGQNLIGPEQGALLGIIRTQELLAARRVDGAQQFFTRAIDFGFSKSAKEAIAKWGHDEILSDIVWVIRRFRPDVIVLRFSGTPRDGHGHHQASAILGKEAFFAAADKNRFPEQLKWVEPWQAKRLMWNAFTFTSEQEREARQAPARIEIDPGEYNPVLGYSYAEIAGMSRSMHRSQGMGAAERKGSFKQYLVHLAGDPATKDVFDGVDTTWARVPGATGLEKLLKDAGAAFRDDRPEETVPALLKARAALNGVNGFWPDLKRKDLDETIALCAGLWVEADADRWNFTPGSEVSGRVSAVIRSNLRTGESSIHYPGGGVIKNGPLSYNALRSLEFKWTIPSDAPLSQPYWLVRPPEHDRYTVDPQLLIGEPENPPVGQVFFVAEIEGERLELTRPVIYRYVDRVEGERTRPIAVIAPASIKFHDDVVLFPSPQPRPEDVEIHSEAGALTTAVRVNAPDGWKITPGEAPVQVAAGENSTVTVTIQPPPGNGVSIARASAGAGGREVSSLMRVISYPHIPQQVVFTPAEARLVRTDVKTDAKTVGYVMGAGDQMPEAIRQLGCEVRLLNADDLSAGDLSRFDAIVTGVRAYNVRPDLRANEQRLLEYVKNGGTLVVQYNVLDNPEFLARIGPYPIRIGRDRVTVEDAPVSFPDPASPLLQTPNRITEEDFRNWVQERGLYFASDWDQRYKPLFESHDPGEPPHPGGTLYTRYGKGAYVFTAYSWFRQLPAGVPGAYRIFANLLSAGKASR